MFMMVVGKMIIIIIKITRGREGAFNNYVDQFLPNFDPTPKVIHTKYSKHRPSTVAHTFECVCSKINHGLNHGLFISLLKLINYPIH